MSIKKEQAAVRDKFNTLISQRQKLLKDIEKLYDEAKQVEDTRLEEWIIDYMFAHSNSYAGFFTPRAEVKEYR